MIGNKQQKVMLWILSVLGFLAALFLLSGKNSNSLSYNLSGTFIIAAIHNDGIVVGADSRSAFLDNAGNVMAFFERSPKIFRYENVVVAMAGKYAFAKSNTSFSGLFKKFQSRPQKSISLKNFYKRFLEFAKSELVTEDYTSLIDNEFFICGYFESHPIIYWYEKSRRDSIKTIGYKTNIKKNNGMEDVIQFLKNSTTFNTVVFVKNVIENVSVENNKNKVSPIGGPASVVSIAPYKIDWIYKQNSNDFSSPDDFVIALQNNQVKMWYRSQVDSIKFRASFKKHNQ